MTNLESVRKHFEVEISILKKSIANEKIARDQAPSAMESHSDTTRNQKDMLIHALEAKLRMLESQMDSIPKKFSTHGTWSVVYSDKLGKDVLIVPDGMGGVDLGSVMLVSEKSPAAKELS